MGESEFRHALIIANDSYDDAGLKKLKAPAQDAVALAEVLRDPDIGDFDVEVVRNEPSHAISLHLEEFFSEARPGDTLVVHFSCHGLKSESGELYFAASNTLPRRLKATAVSADFVRQCIFSTRAHSTALFLDCCYGGAFSRGASARASEDMNVLESFSGQRLGGGRGWAVITASNSMEYAMEGGELTDESAPRPSVFTRAVVQGLSTGEADLNRDGEISLNELYDYVFDHVRQENPHQTPSHTVDMQGNMHLAHNRRGRIKARPPAKEVRDALASKDMFTRLGAIAELRACMKNTDLAIALGASEVLEEVAHKDIRFVADAASQALSEIGVNPCPTQLSFGRVRQHSPSPHQSVRLLGPPLARSCAARPKGNWLRAEESSDGLDIRVDTSNAGHFSGDIVLKGVVSEAVLHVDVEVVPERAWADSTHEHEKSPRQKSLRAPVLAATALGLAVVSAVMGILAVVAAAEAVQKRVVDQWTSLSDHVQDTEMIPALIVSMVTAALALVLTAVARHALRSPNDRYSAGSARTTKLLTSTAKIVALPALIVAAVTGIAFLIARHYV